MSYSWVNMKVDGVNTIGENIADNGGVKEAYHAYRKCFSTKLIFRFKITEKAYPIITQYLGPIILAVCQIYTYVFKKENVNYNHK